MRGRRAALGVALCLALTACAPTEDPALRPSNPSPSPSGPAPTQSREPSGVVRGDFTLPLDPNGTWDPYAGSRSSNMALIPLLCESLFTLDDAFAPQPLLAREAAVSEDGLTWTVRLREGIGFSDGTPLTAQTAARAVNDARGEKSVYARRLDEVRQVSWEGENALVFTLKTPNARFPALLDFPLALVSGTEAVGTGPYALTGDSLTARADWWQDKDLPLASIPLREIENADQLVAAFDAGTLSLAAADPTGADALGYAGSHQSWEYPTSTMLYLGFQQSRGPCREAAFRTAVTRGLDRSALVNQVLGGHASVAALPVPPTAEDYDRTLAAQIGYEPLAAVEALEELGYQAGENGMRQKGKTPLALTLLVNSDNAYKSELAQSIVRGLEELGIRVTLQALPWEEYKKALTAGQFDLYLGECRLTGDLDLTDFFTAGSGLCYGGTPARELTDALALAKGTGEWGEFYRLWVRENPMAVLCFKTGSMLTQWGQVEGARPTQGNLFNGFSDWNIL